MGLGVAGYILLVLAVVIGFRFYQDSPWFQLKCIISDVDGKRYCVRERSKLTMAADRLARVNARMSRLVKQVATAYPQS